MTANDTTTYDAERSIDALRNNFEKATTAVDELVAALEADEADEAMVADAYRTVAMAVVSIEDAAESSRVIDPYTDDWRAVDELRKGIYHATHRIALGDRHDVVSPTADGCRREALRAATSAAEYLDTDEGDR